MITESKIKLNGMVQQLSASEERLYNKIKSVGKLFASDMSRDELYTANMLATKHLVKKANNPENGLYFKTSGRTIKSNDYQEQITEVAPPSKKIEKWITDNKQRFKDEYGKDYKKYLYGKAWKMFNAKESYSFDLPFVITEADYDIRSRHSFSLPDGREILITKKRDYWLVELQTEDYMYIDSVIVNRDGEPLNKENFEEFCRNNNLDMASFIVRIQDLIN